MIGLDTTLETPFSIKDRFCFSRQLLIMMILQSMYFQILWVEFFPICYMIKIKIKKLYRKNILKPNFDVISFIFIKPNIWYLFVHFKINQKNSKHRFIWFYHSCTQSLRMSVNFRYWNSFIPSTRTFM